MERKLQEQCSIKFDTVVPPKWRERDPRTMLFHRKSLPIVYFAKEMDKFCFWRQVTLAEEMAAMQGKRLIPSECLHHKRKKRYCEQRVKVGKLSYYVISESELTRNEIIKYNAVAEAIIEQEGAKRHEVS